MLKFDALRKLLSTPRARWIAAGTLAVVTLAVIAYLVVGGRGCSSRDDVTARVSIASSSLQQAAAQGKIKIEELASGIRKLNAAATSYENTKDHQAYCDALDELMDEYKLD